MQATVEFRGWRCRVIQRRYASGRLALQLIDTGDGEPIATATINLPAVPLAADEVIIKDYSENEGMLAALMAAGVVSAPLRTVQTGYVVVPICRLTLVVYPIADGAAGAKRFSR